MPAAELDATVEKLTATLAGNAPLSLRTNKMTVKAALADLPPLHGEVQEEPAPEADSDAEQLEWK